MSNPFDLRGPEFLQLYLVILALAVLAALVVRAMVSRGGPAANRQLDDFELAYLAGGEKRVSLLAVTNLLDAGAAKLSGAWVTVLDRQYKPPHALTRRLLANLPDTMRLRQVPGLLRSDVALLRNTLQTQQMVVRDEGVWLARATAIVLMGLTTLLGIGKVIVGLSRGRPVGFLVVLCGITIGLTALLCRGPSLTSSGKRLLNGLRERRPKPWRPRSYSQPMDDGLIALWGLDAMTHRPDYAGLRSGYGSNYNTDSSSSGPSGSSCSSANSCSSGSSCGSSCGGGGCGGCGSS